MINRILVPLDGSSLAESALPHAAALADAFDATVRLFRVLDLGRVGGLTGDSLENRLQRCEVEHYLRGHVEKLRAAGVEASMVVGEGKTSEEIVRRVEEDEIDLILATAWGQRGASEFFLGGTARKLVSGAYTSIMLIRPRRPGRSDARPARYDRILVPVDGSRRADWALCLASSVARSQKAELVMVHVVAVPETPARLPRQPAEEQLRRQLVQMGRRAAEQYLEEMRGKFAAPDLDVRWKVVVGSRVPDALLRTARGERAGLIVMSAHGAADDMPWPYGSVAAGLLDYCDLPLLVFQDRPRRARHETRVVDRTRTSIPSVHAPVP